MARLDVPFFIHPFTLNDNNREFEINNTNYVTDYDYHREQNRYLASSSIFICFRNNRSVQ